MKLYYCETPTGIKIYSLNKVITKQKKGVDIKILDVASYDDLCALRERLKIAENTLITCACNRIYASVNAKEYLDKYCKGWDK